MTNRGLTGTTADPSIDIVTVQGNASGVALPVAIASNTGSAASTATLSNVVGSASSVTLIAANSARLGFVIANDSTAILYIKFGSTASTTSFTYQLLGNASGVYVLEGPAAFRYTGIITGIWASATGSARCTEMTA